VIGELGAGINALFIVLGSSKAELSGSRGEDECREEEKEGGDDEIVIPCQAVYLYHEPQCLGKKWIDRDRPRG